MLSQERIIEQQAKVITLLKQKLGYFQNKRNRQIKIWLDVELDEVTKLRADIYKEIDL